MASEMPRSSAAGEQGGAGRVHQRDDRAPETRGQLHHAARFAQTFGRGLAEIALLALFGVAALLVADNGDGAALESGEARDNGAVVAKGAVAVNLGPVAAHRVDVVERVGPLGMARHLDFIPRREAGENFEHHVALLTFNARDLSVEVEVFGGGQTLEFLDLFFDLDQGFFKREPTRKHEK